MIGPWGQGREFAFCCFCRKRKGRGLVWRPPGPQAAPLRGGWAWGRGALYLLPSLPLSRSVQAWHVSGVSLHPLPCAPLTPQSSALPLAKQPTLPPGTECGFWGPRWTLPSPHWNPQICGHKTERSRGRTLGLSSRSRGGDPGRGRWGASVQRGRSLRERGDGRSSERAETPRGGGTVAQQTGRQGPESRHQGRAARTLSLHSLPAVPHPCHVPCGSVSSRLPPSVPPACALPGEGAGPSPQRPWVASGLWVGRSWGAPLPPPAF